VHGVRRRVAVQEFSDPLAGDDDARLPVPRGEYAQPAGLQMERGRVPATGQWMHDDHDLELAALQAVGGVDRDLRLPSTDAGHRRAYSRYSST
jgi:hypothetical protein